MRMHSGLAGSVRPVAATRIEVAVLPHDDAGARSVSAVAAALRRRAARRGLLLGATATSLLLIGCAAMPLSGWRVEPSLRLTHSEGTSVAQGYLALARQYDGEGRTAKALDAYRKAAAARATDPELLHTLGVALAEHGQLSEAIVQLRRAAVLTPDRAPLLNNLGYALMLDRRPDEAQAMLRLALAIDPSHALARRNLAQLAPSPLAATASVAAAPIPAAMPPVDQVTQAVAAATAAAPVDLTGKPAVPGPAVHQVPNLPPMTQLSATAVGFRAETPVPQAMQLSAAGAAPQVAVMPSVPAMTVGLAELMSKPVAASAPATVSLKGLQVEIFNGNGVEGLAARTRAWLSERGVISGRLANLLPYDTQTTQVRYRPGHVAQARELSRRLPTSSEIAVADEGQRAELRVVLGHDLRHSANCGALAACTERAQSIQVAAAPK